MTFLSRQQRTYCFSANNPPAARIHPGETVILETEDSGSHRITKMEDIATYIPRHDYTNPATGPVYVEGARPGDTLSVTIERIELDSSGYTKLSPGAGLLINHVQVPACQIWRIDGAPGAYHLSWGPYQLPARPMLGVIGVAPAHEEIYNFAAGPHGGNLDVPAVTEGATVYLPIFTPGALLGLGDVHALQGDGEISGVALETRARVTARVDLLAGVAWARPWIETTRAWITVGIAPDVRSAMEQATADMLALLEQHLSLTSHDALMLLGVAGDMRPGQTIFEAGTPLTVYLTVPKP